MAPPSKSPTALAAPGVAKSPYNRPRRSCTKSVSIAPEVSVKSIDELVKIIQVATEKLNDVHLEEIMAEEGEFVSGVHKIQGTDRGSTESSNINSKNKSSDMNINSGTRRSSRRHLPSRPYSPSQQPLAKSINGNKDLRNKPNQDIRRLELSPDNIDQASALLGVTSHILRKWYNMYCRAKSKGFDFDAHRKDLIKDHASVFFKPDKIKIADAGNSVLDGWCEIILETFLNAEQLQLSSIERQRSPKRRKKDSNTMAEGGKNDNFKDTKEDLEPTKVSQSPSAKSRSRDNRRESTKSSQSGSKSKLLKSVPISELPTESAKTHINPHILSNLRPNSRIFVKWQADGSLYKATVKKLNLEKNPMMLKVHYDGKKSHIVNDVNVELVEGFIEEEGHYDQSYHHDYSKAIIDGNTKSRKRKRKKRGKKDENAASNTTAENSERVQKSDSAQHEKNTELNVANAIVPQNRRADLNTALSTKTETKTKDKNTMVTVETLNTTAANPTANMDSKNNSHRFSEGSAVILPSIGSLPVTTATHRAVAAIGPTSVAGATEPPNVEAIKHGEPAFLPPSITEHFEQTPYLGPGWMVHTKTRKRRESAKAYVNSKSQDHENATTSREIPKKPTERIDRFFVSPCGKRCRSIAEERKSLSNIVGDPMELNSNNITAKETSFIEAECETHTNDPKGIITTVQNPSMTAHNSKNEEVGVHSAGIAKLEATESDGKETDNLQQITTEIKGIPPNSVSIGYKNGGTALATETAPQSEQSKTSGSHTDCKFIDSRQLQAKDMAPLAPSAIEVNGDVNTRPLISAKEDSITSSAAKNIEASLIPTENDFNESAVSKKDSVVYKNTSPPIHVTKNCTDGRESTPDSLKSDDGKISKSEDSTLDRTRIGIDPLNNIERTITADDSVAICNSRGKVAKVTYNSIVESKNGLVHDSKTGPLSEEEIFMEACAAVPKLGSHEDISLKHLPSISVPTQNDVDAETDDCNHLRWNGTPKKCFPLNDATKGLEIIESAMSGSTLPFSATHSVSERHSRSRAKIAVQKAATLEIGRTNLPSSAVEGAIGVPTRFTDSSCVAVDESKNLPSDVANPLIDAIPMVLNRDGCELSERPDHLKLLVEEEKIGAVADENAASKSADAGQPSLPSQIANDASTNGAEGCFVCKERGKGNHPDFQRLSNDSVNVDESIGNHEPVDASQDECLRDLDADVAECALKNSNAASVISNSDLATFSTKTNRDGAVSGAVSLAETLTKNINDPSTTSDPCTIEEVFEASGPENVMSIDDGRKNSPAAPTNENNRLAFAFKLASDETNVKTTLGSNATSTANAKEENDSEYAAIPVQRYFEIDSEVVENNDSIAIPEPLGVTTEGPSAKFHTATTAATAEQAKACINCGDMTAVTEALDADKSTMNNKPMGTTPDGKILVNGDTKDPSVADVLEHVSTKSVMPNSKQTSSSRPPDANIAAPANESLAKCSVDYLLVDHSLVKDAIKASDSVSLNATTDKTQSSAAFIIMRESLSSDISKISSYPMELSMENLYTTEDGNCNNGNIANADETTDINEYMVVEKKIPMCVGKKRPLSTTTPNSTKAGDGAKDGTIHGQVGDDKLSEVAVSSDRAAVGYVNKKELPQKDGTFRRDLLTSDANDDVLQSESENNSSLSKPRADTAILANGALANKYSGPSSSSDQAAADKYSRNNTETNFPAAPVNESESSRSIETKRGQIDLTMNDETTAAGEYQPENTLIPAERNISDEVGIEEMDNSLPVVGKCSPSCVANVALPLYADKGTTFRGEAEHDNIPGVRAPADGAIDVYADESDDVGRDHSLGENIMTKDFPGGLNVAGNILDVSKPDSNPKPCNFFVQSHADTAAPATGACTTSADTSAGKHSFEATNSDLDDPITAAAKVDSSTSPVDEGGSLPSDAMQAKYEASSTAIDGNTVAATDVINNGNKVFSVERDDINDVGTAEKKSSVSFTTRRHSSHVVVATTTIDIARDFNSSDELRAGDVASAVEPTVQDLNANSTVNDEKPKHVFEGEAITKNDSSGCHEIAEDGLENKKSSSVSSDSEFSACSRQSNVDSAVPAKISSTKSIRIHNSSSYQSRVHHIIKSNDSDSNHVIAVGTGGDSSPDAKNENRSFPLNVANLKRNLTTATKDIEPDKGEEKRSIQVEKNVGAERKNAVAFTDFGGVTSSPFRMQKVPTTVDNVNDVKTCEEAATLSLENAPGPANSAVNDAEMIDDKTIGIVPVQNMYNPESPSVADEVFGRSNSQSVSSVGVSTKSLKLPKAFCTEPAQLAFKKVSSVPSSKSDHSGEDEVIKSKGFVSSSNALIEIPLEADSSTTPVEKGNSSLSDLVKAKSDQIMTVTVNTATTAIDGKSEFNENLNVEVGSVEKDGVFADLTEGRALPSHVHDYIKMDDAEKGNTSCKDAGTGNFQEVKESTGEDVHANTMTIRQQSKTISGGVFNTDTGLIAARVSNLRRDLSYSGLTDVSCENSAANQVTSPTTLSFRSNPMSRGSKAPQTDESVSNQYSSSHRSNGKPSVVRKRPAQSSSKLENGNKVKIRSIDEKQAGGDATYQSGATIGASYFSPHKEADEVDVPPRLIEHDVENSKISTPSSYCTSIAKRRSEEVQSEPESKVEVFNAEELTAMERTTHNSHVGGGVAELTQICDSTLKLPPHEDDQTLQQDKNSMDEFMTSSNPEEADVNYLLRLDIDDKELQQNMISANELKVSSDIKESKSYDSSTTGMETSASFSKCIDAANHSGDEELDPDATTKHSQDIQSCMTSYQGKNITDFFKQGSKLNMPTAELSTPGLNEQMPANVIRLDSIVAKNDNEPIFPKEGEQSLEVACDNPSAKTVQIPQERSEAWCRSTGEGSNPESNLNQSFHAAQGLNELDLKLQPRANEAVAEDKQSATSHVDVTDTDGHLGKNFIKHVVDCESKSEIGSTDTSLVEKDQGKICRSSVNKYDATLEDPLNIAFASKTVDIHVEQGDVNYKYTNNRTKIKRQLDDQFSDTKRDIMSNASPKTLLQSNIGKPNQLAHLSNPEDRDSTGSSISTVNGSIDGKSVVLSEKARLSDVEDKNTKPVSQHTTCFSNSANIFDTSSAIETSGNVHHELDEKKPFAKPLEEEPDELLDEDFLFVRSIVPRGIEDIRNDTMDDEVHEALTGLEGLFDQSDSESIEVERYDFPSHDQLTITAPSEGIDTVALSAARFGATSRIHDISAGDTETESSTQPNTMLHERPGLCHNLKGKGLKIKSIQQINQSYYQNPTESTITNRSHSNIRDNPDVSSTTITKTELSETLYHTACVRPNENFSLPQQASIMVDNLPSPDGSFRDNHKEMLPGERQIDPESKSRKTFLFSESGDVKSSEIRVATKVDDMHQSPRELIDDSLDKGLDSKRLSTSISVEDFHVSQSEETGRLESSVVASKTLSKALAANSDNMTTISKPNDCEQFLSGDTMMSSKKAWQLAMADPSSTDSNVQLVAFNNDVPRKSARRARTKRKLKSAARFEPLASVVVDSCKTGEGFNCPRCSAAGPFDSKVCGTCSLEFSHEANAGDIILIDQNDVSGKVSFEKKVAPTHGIIIRRQNHATSPPISNVNESTPEQKPYKEIKHKPTPTKDPESRILLCNCPSCDRKFTTQGLYAHFARAHEGKLDWGKVTYTCPFCSSNRNDSFLSRNAAQEHVTEAHPGCFLLQTHISIASKTKSPIFNANAKNVQLVTQNQIKTRSREKRSSRSSSSNFNTKSTLSQPVSSNIPSYIPSKTRKVLEQNNHIDINTPNTPPWTHLEFTQLLPDTKKTYPQCLSRVIEILDEKCREQEEITEAARDQRFKLCKDSAELDLRSQDEERLTYQRGIRERTRLADAERIEKQKFTEEAHQMIMRFEYENRNRKRNKTEIEFDKLCSRPIFFSKTKLRNANHARNTCKNADCQFCKGDSIYLAQILLKNELDNFNNDGNPIESPVFTHSTTVLNPFYQEIISDEYFIKAEKISEYESADATTSGGNVAPTRIKISRRDVNTAKRLRIEEEKLRKMNETKYSLEFIEKYNKGLIKCAWSECKSMKRKR
ncbi:hypothetical protein ACHAXS_013273 [Conticribra weissflogii]